MNLVGKIFVVLIFFMSVAFMAFAVMVYAAHTNWPEAVADLQTKLQEERKANTDLTAQKDARIAELNAESAAALQASAKQETANQLMAASKSTLAQQVESLTTAQTKAIEAATLAQQKYESLRNERDQLAQRIKVAETDQTSQFTKATTLQDRLQVALGQNEILKERETQLVGDLTRLRAITKNLPAAASTTAAPKVDGVILAVGANDLVEVSIGSDDGIEIGHQLDVYRDNKYLGRVRILKTDPDRSVATILRDYSQGVIQKGDRVTSSRQT